MNKNIDAKIIKLVDYIFENVKELDETIFIKEIEPNLYYAGLNTKRRGIGTVIIGSDLKFLYGNSSINYDKLIENYKNGIRTEFDINIIDREDNNV